MTAVRVPTRKPTLVEVLKILESLHGSPMQAERADDPLVDHLLVGVLGLHAGEAKARQAVRALSETFLDFNEVRSSPLSELAEALNPHLPEGKVRKAAEDVRMALQDVYDGTHGLDLEPLRGREPEDQRTFLKDLPNTDGGPAAGVFQIALGEGRLALGPRERRLLDRLGMLPRASNNARLRAAMEKLIPPPERLRFTWVTGAAARDFETGDLPPDAPFVKLLVACKAKELAERARQKKREEARRIAEEKRRAQEEAKRLRAEEIERKKREKEEARKAALQKRAEAKKAAEVARREREKAKALAAKKKAAAAKKKASAKPKSKAKKRR
jgi:hypothetical protein